MGNKTSQNIKDMKKISIAKLEPETNLYLGVEFINPSKLTNKHVQVPEDCDLTIGGYFWDINEKTFKPTVKHAVSNLIKNRGII
jgi:hypothetical protein